MLKKIFFLAAVALSFQKSLAQKFQGSIILGATTTQVSGDQLAGFDKSGFIAGGGITLPLHDKFDMGMEIIFIQKGSKTSNNDSLEYYKMKLNYAQVPIVFEYKFSNRFHFHLAPSIGALLSAKEEDLFGEVNESSPFEKYEIGIGGGMSFYFSDNLSIKLRITQSLMPIRKIGVNSRYVVSGQYNSGLEFTVQYHFTNKKKEASQ